MKKNKKILFLVCSIFLISIAVSFLGIRYSEDIVRFFSQNESEVFYVISDDFTCAIKYISIYTSIYLGIVSQILLVYLLVTQFFQTENRLKRQEFQEENIMK